MKLAFKVQLIAKPRNSPTSSVNHTPGCCDSQTRTCYYVDSMRLGALAITTTPAACHTCWSPSDLNNQLYFKAKLALESVASDIFPP